MDHWKLGLQQLKNYLVTQGYDSRVIGLTLTGQSSQEWISWDANFTAYSNIRPMVYGKAHREAYAQWHLQRYGSALEVPSEAEFEFLNFKNPASSAFVDLNYSANVVHYFQFRNELTANTINVLAAEAKKIFTKAKVGVIYGYMNEMGGDPSFGHNGLGILVHSKAIDFINPMSSYHDRVVKGADFERQPITSLGLNGKLILNDLAGLRTWIARFTVFSIDLLVNLI